MGLRTFPEEIKEQSKEYHMPGAGTSPVEKVGGNRRKSLTRRASARAGVSIWEHHQEKVKGQPEKGLKRRKM